jgi:hypothetical protein
VLVATNGSIQFIFIYYGGGWAALSWGSSRRSLRKSSGKDGSNEWLPP